MLRKEDDRLLRGGGRYLDDIEEPARTVHLAIVRSTHAHARIVSVAAGEAFEVPGVVAILRGDDFTGLLHPLCGDGPLPGFAATERPPICTDRALFVGDVVALVLATDPYLAEDAAGLVEVEYESLPATVSIEQAMTEGSPAVHAEVPDNVLFRNAQATEGFDAQFASAPHVFRETFTTSRVSSVSLETRGCLACYDEGLKSFTLWTSSQVPHIVRSTICEVLGLSDTELRVVAPDVGGGFGMKASVYPEEIIVTALARRLRRPVKWVGDRQDDFLASSHARDMRIDVEMGVQEDGTLVGFRLDVVANAGAYPGVPFGSSLEAGGGPRTFPGPYRFRHYAFRTRAVATNTCPSGPYRAVAAPVAFFALEGMMDRAARALGLDPVSIRRCNLLRPEDFPYVNAGGIRYDVGNYTGLLERALELSGYEAFRKSQRSCAPDAGKLRGIGIACITEQTGQGSSRYRARGLRRIPGIEGARLKVEPNGKAVLMVSQPTQGQGHLTTFAQLAAEDLGIPPEDITVIEGDTALTPFGTGTFASRSVVAGGGAVITASRVIAAKMRRIAGELLEVAAEDIVLRDGNAEVAGVAEMHVPIEEIARIAYSMGPRAVPRGESFGLETTEYYDPPVTSVSSAVHVAQVAVDRVTGQVEVERYSVVHDCGRMVNPLIVDGQTHGAVAQGLGPALMERVIYDDTGQLLTTTLLDYLLPTAMDVPDMQLDHFETPATDTLGGVRGMAESGVIGAIPAIANAVSDALRPYGYVVNRIPIRPEELLRAISAGNER